MSRLLGPMVTSFTVKRSGLALLQRETGALGLAMDEAFRQNRPDPSDPVARAERPRFLAARERMRRFAEDQLPAVILSCPGTSSVQRESDGRYAAVYEVGVNAVISSTDEDVGQEQANLLGLAAAHVLLNLWAKNDPRVTGVTWLGEQNDTQPTTETRSYFTAVYGLEVVMEGVLSDGVAYPDPIPDDPTITAPPVNPGDAPLIETTTLNVEPVETLT